MEALSNHPCPALSIFLEENEGFVEEENLVLSVIFYVYVEEALTDQFERYQYEPFFVFGFLPFSLWR